jgi:hypothetical protein
MAEYVFKGGAPFEYEDEDGLLLVVHPLDVAEFDEEPGAPWEAIEPEEPDEAETPAKTPDTPPVVITPDGPREPAPKTEG